jgi:hypothetical protein
MSRRNNVELPLSGQTVTEIRFGRGVPVTFVFGDKYDTEIRIEEAIALYRGQSETFLTGSRPGDMFNVSELGPVLALFGQTVLEALALSDGMLHLRFQGDLRLCIVPSTGYEAWHFRSPRLRLHGAYGHLI